MFVGGQERGKTALTFKPVRKILFFLPYVVYFSTIRLCTLGNSCTVFVLLCRKTLFKPVGGQFKPYANHR